MRRGGVSHLEMLGTALELGEYVIPRSIPLLNERHVASSDYRGTCG